MVLLQQKLLVKGFCNKHVIINTSDKEETWTVLIQANCCRTACY